MTQQLDFDFLHSLLRATGPSSFESQPARIWREQASKHGAEVRQDAYGNSFASFNSGKKLKIIMAGHIDEIGLIVTHIDDKGFLSFKGIGGWDPSQLIGQRVRILGYKGEEVLGAIGRKPIHLMDAEDSKKPSKIKDMWIDIGAKDKEDAAEVVRVGDVAVIEQQVITLRNGRIVSKAIDNRIGAYIVLEAARRCQGCEVEVVALACVQEEIGGIGAYIASYQEKPDLAFAIDVTHCTDMPNINKKQEGEAALGKGVALSVGSYVHFGLFQQLITTAEQEDIPFAIETSPRVTYTDADDLAKNHQGVPTAVISIPNRYMHSPNEMIAPEDVESVISLLVAHIKSLDENSTFMQPER